MRYRTPLLLATAALLLSCGDAAPERSGEAATEDMVYQSRPSGAPNSVAPVSPTALTADAALQGGSDSDPAATGTTAVPSMLIRTGEARLEVDSVERAVGQVRELAQRLGGYVGNTTLTGGRQQARAASLELKLPAERFDQALSGLGAIGRAESVNATAQDVGEEYVDLQARRTNAARMEQRLVELLGSRTGSLEDVLAVERELARVREEIERFDGRLRYLRTRTAVSTLTVHLHERQALLDDGPGANPIARAVRRAWQNFVGFVAALIESLGVLIPMGVLLLGAAWLLRRLWRIRRPQG